MASSRKNHKSTRQIHWYAILPALILVCVIGFVFYNHLDGSVSGDEIANLEETERVDFVVDPSDNLETIAMRLEHEGLIKNNANFIAYVKAHCNNKKARPGTYRLSAAMPLKRISMIVMRPKGAARVITIPQGVTLSDIATLFEKKEICSKKEFWKTVRTGAFEGYPFLVSPGQDDTRLEGYLFPGTYEYEDNMDPESIMELMLDNFSAHFDKIPKRTNKLNDRETVILASMLEREARSDGEKPAIASVYVNRLKKNMPLQCDATIVYAMGAPGRSLNYADYELKSPYNTYQHKGFPPSPICNPSMTSLVAAANPAKTNYYFYLFNTQTHNAHVFASTYEEHLKNRKIYGYD
ncbi:MAG: endolytic transglycosylase MltG [Clostridiales bacterium]|nr:endolytic transglycosylase MltG [Peptococcus niger]MDU7244495.1 endolytic transglycosylase MltG [Clostridiales bacterium]